MPSKKESQSWQKRVKEDHEASVITLLKERGPLQFKELMAESAKIGIKSPKGLSEVLKRMEIKKKLIRKTHKKIQKEVPPKLTERGERILQEPITKIVEAYELTENGQAYYNGIWRLMQELLEAKDKNAGYFHSESYAYYAFGFSHAGVMMGKSNLDLLLTPIPQIEDVFFKSLVEGIKQNKVVIKENDDAKTILTFEFDWKKFTDEITGLRIFIDDILNDKDVFLDERLYLNKTLHRLWNLDHLVNYSLLIGNSQFREKLEKYLKKTLTRAGIRAIIDDLDFKLLEDVVKSVKEGKEPLDDKRLVKKLVFKSEEKESPVLSMPIFVYLIVARLMNFDNPVLYDKIADYEKKLKTPGSNNKLEEINRDFMTEFNKAQEELFKKKILQ